MDYNPLKMPCDWNLARKHALARRTAPDTKDLIGDDHDNKKPETCPCCGFEIERKEIPFCDDIKSLKFLGAGFPLFYSYLKFCIVLLALQGFVGIFNMLSNYNGTFCDTQYLNTITQQMETNCKESLFLKLSIANKLNNSDLVIFVQKANFILLIFTMILLQFFRRFQIKMDTQIDESQLTPSDYTIMVTNIPKTLSVNYRWELTNIFQNYAVIDCSTEIIVTKVVLIYDLQEIEIEEQKIQNALSKKKIALETSNRKYDNVEVVDADKEILICQQKINDLQEEYFWTNRQFSGIALVSFENEKMKDLILASNKSNWLDRIKAYFYQGKIPNLDEMELQWHSQKLFLSQAPEPNDILWNNLAIITTDKILARIKSTFITLFIESFTFISIYWLSCKFLSVDYLEEIKENQNGIYDEESLKKVRQISFIICLSIVLINKIIIEPIMKWITEKERISTNTKFQISYANKLTISLFINAAIVSYIIDIVIFGNAYHPGGFLYNESIIFILNATISPLLWLVDPWSFFKRLWRDHQVQKVNDALLTQQEANILMEEVDYQLAIRYADIIKTIWFCMFFSTALPIGVFCSIIGLSAYYFIDKYNILRRRTVKESISLELSLQMINLLEYIVLFNPLGNMAVTQFLEKSYDIYSVSGLIFGIIYTIFPIHKCIDNVFPIRNFEKIVSYKTAQVEFDTDYDRENPITKSKAIPEYSLQLQGIQVQEQIEYAEIKC